MLDVTYYFREKRQFGYSIEGIFYLMRDCLRGKVRISEFHLDPARSRMQNIMTARTVSGSINHITGDVYYLAIGFKGRNTILTIHDLGHYHNLKSNRIKFFLYHFFWLYFPLRKARVITVVSEYTGKQLVESFPFVQKKLRLVYNPVKPVFEFVPKQALNKPPVILQIGSGPHKNLVNLIKACFALKIHINIIASVDSEASELLNSGGISYTQLQNLSEEELFEQYKQCDILFFASFTEGFGMPIIEAQTVGRPVITSNFGAMEEVAGDSALLVNPNSVTEIREAIIKLTSDHDLYRQLVEKGIENVKKYNRFKISADYLDIYKEVAAG
jgi:glycosyltransferase involved in cell wall biosynthesis